MQDLRWFAIGSFGFLAAGAITVLVSAILLWMVGLAVAGVFTGTGIGLALLSQHEG